MGPDAVDCVCFTPVVARDPGAPRLFIGDAFLDADALAVLP
jgi:hypothetical protein